MTTTSTDVQNAFQYYINYTEGKLYKITYKDGNTDDVDVEGSQQIDFNYNIGDTNPNSLTVDSINAKSITTDTLDTKEIIMPITNKDGSTDPDKSVTITAIVDEVDEDGAPLPSLNLDI